MSTDVPQLTGNVTAITENLKTITDNLKGVDYASILPKLILHCKMYICLQIN